MRKLKLLTILTLGVMASSSGMIQVGAATYNYFVDFATKEVANFNDYKQTFNEDTSNLKLKVNFTFDGTYRFDSCPTAFQVSTRYRLLARANATGVFTIIQEIDMPNFVCNTSTSFYNRSISGNLSSSFLDLVVDDDTNFLQFASQIVWSGSGASNGRTLYLSNYTYYFDLTYDFGTTYLFNYFLSDQAYSGRVTSGTWTFNQTATNYLNYVYTTAGNDFYYIRNSNPSNIGFTRKKYAIDYNQEFFRGNSVGAGFFRDHVGVTPDQVVLSVNNSALRHDYNYYYLNTANVAQAIVTAPVISFTQQTCSGGFLDINVPCFVNNAIAYLVNDAPVISDAFTLLNTGIELAAQTFGIIGNFTDDNVFGYLILIGFGFIAVKWFLKNDE